MSTARIPAGLYPRVSTDEQTTENQRAPLQQLAEARGWEPIWYEETGSAVKHRPVFEQMMKDARAGRLRVVAVVALDRLGRSMVGVINTVLELDRLGVRVVSLREPWLDMGGPTRTLLLAVFAWMAEQERTVLVERTHEGLRRARRRGTRSGKAIGRPLAPEARLAAAKALVDAGHSVREAAQLASQGRPREERISASTLGRYISGTWRGAPVRQNRVPEQAPSAPDNSGT